MPVPPPTSSASNGDAATLAAPRSWVESVSDLRLPEPADHRLGELMDRNNDGALSDAERRELASLVEVSEMLSLVRADALHLLGRRPQ